jgi:glycosyltransferase involved in cell wall biosynthesis
VARCQAREPVPTTRTRVRALRILIFHGYLLGGTGSNVYNARLAAALVRAGHEVHLLCQDRDPFHQEWVDAAGDWDGGALALEARREPARATVYRPNLGGLLPVYVPDRYDGVEARPFPELSDADLAGYLERNVAAVREVAGRARPDVALANHLVMGPVVLARGLEGLEVPYAVKVHGSALEYTVKPHPRFLPYAREGLAGARGVLVGSRHTAESLWAAMGDPELARRTRLGPPGVDVAQFAPRDPAAARAGLEALAERVRAAPPGTAGSSFARDPAAAAEALAAVDPLEDRIVVFVGKLIASKGMELLLAAWPLVLARVPAARLVVVGFGAFREGLEALAAELARGDLAAARATRGEHGEPLGLLDAYLEGLAEADAARYALAAAAMPERVTWVGRLDHDELAELLPAAEAMVVPSTFPEAFGMVAAEAAACGALPVVARHSGLAEVAETLAGAIPEAARALLAFDLGPGAVPALAAAVAGWLEAPAELRAATRDAMVAVTRERYSWDGVASTVLAAAQGRLDGLPSP